VDILLDLSFESVFSLIKTAREVHSVDSWVKTFSLMCGVDTILYESILDRSIIGMSDYKDASDFVFLDGWNIKRRIPQGDYR
jgi:hypothetical protein